MMLWFKPNWRPADMDDSKQSSWHCLFQERLAEGKERVGSGQLWLWFWGAMLRGDIAEPEDHYRTAGTSGMEQDAWAHIAFTWDAKRGSQLYLNGVPVGSTSDGSSPLKITKGGAYSAVANRFESFFVGSSSRWAQADGAIDEFRIYDRVLKPEEIVAEMAAVSPLRVDCLSPFVVEMAGETKLRWNITNVGDRPLEESFSWKVTGTPNQGRAGGTLAPGAQRGFDLDLNGLAAGRYTLVVEPAVGPARSASAWVMRGKNAYLKAPGQLVSEPVETIDFVKGIDPLRTQCQLWEAGPLEHDGPALRRGRPRPGAGGLRRVSGDRSGHPGRGPPALHQRGTHGTLERCAPPGSQPEVRARHAPGTPGALRQAGAPSEPGAEGAALGPTTTGRPSGSNPGFND